jgi:hypothetical protein
MKPYVIYILGSSHSGSTILQYLLSGRQGVIGLGEVRQIASKRRWDSIFAKCSCGQPVKDCTFWKELELFDGETSIEWYRRLTLMVSSNYRNITHIVDSSKAMYSIWPWIEMKREGLISDLRIIYLVRDVRGWAVSDVNRRKRKKRPWRPILISMVNWWINQFCTLHFLKKNRLKFSPIVVSYESLVFKTDLQVDRMVSFCNIKGEKSNWENTLKNSNVHDVTGNRMKDNPSARQKIIYDDRWQYRFSINLALPLFYPIWRLNSKLRIEGGI